MCIHIHTHISISQYLPLIALSVSPHINNTDPQQLVL
jgi:hypothetical protein